LRADSEPLYPLSTRKDGFALNLTSFLVASKNAFGVLRQPEKLCGDDSEKDKRETYKTCIV
jgi:hypothetical protein